MGLLDTLQTALDRVTGAEARRQVQREIDQERAKQEAQRQAKLLAEKELDSARRPALVEPERKRSVEREHSPVDRLMKRDLVEPERKPEPPREVEATRMEYSRERQAGPSMPGMGTTFVNTRVNQVVLREQAQERQVEQQPAKADQYAAMLEDLKQRQEQRRQETRTEAERVSRLTPDERGMEQAEKQLQREAATREEHGRSMYDRHCR